MSGHIANRFPRGILRRELFVGTLGSVSASGARVLLSEAVQPSGMHFESGRYGRGEVGELVLIEGQVDLVLARLVDVSAPEIERGQGRDLADVQAIGVVQFLGTVRTDNLRVTAGVASYPRLGDRVYAAPHGFVAEIPSLMEERRDNEIRLTIGSVSGKREAEISVRPEKLFGRHCAVLGATGGGKSWTVARLLDEAAAHRAKVILLDATGEYRTFRDPSVKHCHLGDPINGLSESTACSMPPSEFSESDFIALFEPSGKIQGPKLRDAMRHLRLAHLDPSLAKNGVIKKARQAKKIISDAEREFAEQVCDPSTPFDPWKLSEQINQECVHDSLGGKEEIWGEIDPQALTWCLGLRIRIDSILRSPAFAPVFQSKQLAMLSEHLSAFYNSEDDRVLRVDVSGLYYEFHAREVIANAIGRSLLRSAREGRFRTSPLIVVVDEAHNFLGRKVGNEEAVVSLDAFELIAREGRKYGLTICLATQRPRDITAGVLSQIGTLIVHRLTNERDREIVERACGETDRAATAFLANLRQGEAAIIGVDFPIPLTIQIREPAHKPLSDGPDYQKAWMTEGQITASSARPKVSAKKRKRTGDSK